MSIFDKRVAFKPFEYPEVIEYKKAINHSYWLVSEWNFLSDVQDFNVKLSESERNVIKNAMLAISQIEISVKKFWTKLGDRFPKAEFDQVGVTFGDSEVRHADAYSQILEVLGLNNEFDMLMQNPVIQGRVDYLTKYLKASDDTNKSYALTLTLFSIFIENVSLFSQFVIIKSFNKHLNILKDIDNVVQATQQEECYSEDTEVLTPKGWVFLKDIKEGDAVCQFNEDRTIEETVVLHKTERHHKGEMYKIFHPYGSCFVTPNHEMVYYNKKELVKEIAKTINYSRDIHVPCGGYKKDGVVDSLSAVDRLKIKLRKAETLYGEKFTHRLGSQDKPGLRNILEEANVPYEYKNKKFYVVFNHDQNYEDLSWVDLSNKTKNWCRQFVQELTYQTVFRSMNEKDVDIGHAAAVLAGYISRKVKRGRFYSLKVRLQNSILPKASKIEFEKSLITNYDGKVYCVTVESGMIITRHNGKICVAGNCTHALFGVYLINQIKKEFPQWFDDMFYDKLYKACDKAYIAECNIIDWIFEKGELSFLPKDVVKEFIKDRFNQSLEMIGAKKVFDIDQEKLAKVKWFNDELQAEVNVDFFYKKSVNYSKAVKPITADDLF